MSRVFAPNDIDPFPLNPGETSGYIEGRLRNLAEFIGSQEPWRFIAPNTNAALARRNALSTLTNTTAILVAAGRCEAAAVL